MAGKIRRITILVADDDADDRKMIKDAFEEITLAGKLQFVEDGEETMDYLHHRGKYTNLAQFSPAQLLLLDLNMPKKDGYEVIREIRTKPYSKANPDRGPHHLEGGGGCL
jgi:CheY-like chemotaxis protein